MTVAGLDSAEVKRRRETFGPNKLPEPPSRSAVLRLSQFHNVLIYVLLVSAAFTAILGHLVDTSVIPAVVIVNAVIDFVQEGRTDKALTARS